MKWPFQYNIVFRLGSLLFSSFFKILFCIFWNKVYYFFCITIGSQEILFICYQIKKYSHNMYNTVFRVGLPLFIHTFKLSNFRET